MFGGAGLSYGSAFPGLSSRLGPSSLAVLAMPLKVAWPLEASSLAFLAERVEERPHIPK